MADNWYNKDDVHYQGTHALAVTPNDGADLGSVPKALYVGGGGDITMIGTNAAPGAAGVLWKAVPAGAVLPFRPRRILATGTTATSILAIY
jgi:hypothetical protein